jgi:hypothetical protein
MASPASSAGEQIYECEVKRLHVLDGKKQWRWVKKAVREAISEADAEVRCKDCHGAVKVHGKHVLHGPAPHVEHKSRQDSEYCPSGMYFRLARDGRQPKLSKNPVI